ncbi:hypothetical protein [Spirosoma spitsbergense]|uniref:hypothetical protein n=1 Tax=Spirosoma spitsbergense TaxID=431554 RepID=UPI0012FC08D4|nr:hypothetical protein [Spirosoma spitsbergense]
MSDGVNGLSSAVFTRSKINQEGVVDGRFGLAKIARDKDFRVTSIEKARPGRAFSVAENLLKIAETLIVQSILMYNQPACANG